MTLPVILIIKMTKSTGSYTLHRGKLDMNRRSFNFRDMKIKEIRIISHGTPDYDAEVALRYKVLREPLGLNYTPEQLTDEKDEIHINAFSESGIVGCLLLKRVSDSEIKMRQVAVAEDHQGEGIGGELVRFCEEYARSCNYKVITLHARESAVKFYLSLGYEITGDRFTEVTLPHFPMRKNIGPLSPARIFHSPEK